MESTGKNDVLSRTSFLGEKYKIIQHTAQINKIIKKSNLKKTDSANSSNQAQKNGNNIIFFVPDIS